MSSLEDHIGLANRNQRVLDYLMLDPATCAEWVAVTAFYKSLHVVEAIFASQMPPIHVHNHHARLDRLKERRYAPLYPSFRVLWSASIVARYLEHDDPPVAGHPAVRRPYACFDDYLSIADLKTNLLDRSLVPFENMAISMLAPGGPGLVRYTPPA